MDAYLVADIFLSDVHLRLDKPERSERLRLVVDRFGPGDAIYVVGDLCDFWFASRQLRDDASSCVGLQSLADFSHRGGRLVILGGNHDQWLGDFFIANLGATWVIDKLRFNSFGTKVLLSHGHRLGARSLWKAGMESRLFLETFSRLPNSIAHHLEAKLERSNDLHRAEDDRVNLEKFRREVDKLEGVADVVILGHIHQLVDEQRQNARMIVLGSWHERSNYLIIGPDGFNLISKPD